jgi:hypothetical protein
MFSTPLNMQYIYQLQSGANTSSNGQEVVSFDPGTYYIEVGVQFEPGSSVAGSASDMIGIALFNGASGTNPSAYTTIVERAYIPCPNEINRWGLTGAITLKFDSPTDIYFYCGYNATNPNMNINLGVLLVSKIE